MGVCKSYGVAAFYTGLANAISAGVVAQNVFAERKIGPDHLPAASPSLLPLDEAAEAQRAARVGEQFGRVFPGTTKFNTLGLTVPATLIARADEVIE
jgi:4-carboxymuconolactone decarboxylase